MKSTDDLIKILSYGGGVIIDATKSTDDLVRLVSYTKNGEGARVIIRGASSKSTQDLVRIASHGGGTVIFDLLT